MPGPAAKQGDMITATDMHMIQPPGPTSPVLVPHPFTGVIDGGCVSSVMIEGRPVAVVGSTATNIPPHIPIGGTFVKPPTNKATILKGSMTVLVGGMGIARAGDPAMTCNDPVDLPVGTVVAAGTVMIGD